MRFPPRRSFATFLSAAFLALCVSTSAQTDQPPVDRDQHDKVLRADPDVPLPYKNWLDQDVRWIITDGERAAFKLLKADQERDQFAVAFWQKRNPTPWSMQNDFKKEHYRRLLYANQHFGAADPGWKTDRGRFYIMYGAPDDIEVHPTGATYPFSKPPVTNLPYETWRYGYIEGVGEDVMLAFADICGCGDYRMVEAPDDHPVRHSLLQPDNLKIPAEYQQPRIQRHDLYEIVTHRVSYTLVPFSVRTDFAKATDFTTVVGLSISIPNQALKFAPGQEADRATVNIIGSLTNESGRVKAIFEDTLQVDIPHAVLPIVIGRSNVYRTAVELEPGEYRLGIAIQDVSGDHLGSQFEHVSVPQ